MTSISYCISVCNEAEELNKLLGELIPNIDSEDEIIILADTSKITSEVSQVISNFKAFKPIELIGADLNGDFATFKNNFIGSATKDYIFQIDADETLNSEMFLSLKQVLEFNPEVDIFFVPRENYVSGLTQNHINQWRWQVDEKQRINFPDYQQRLFKNNKQIKWKNKVHEVLEGYNTFSPLPNDYCLIHSKTIEKQEKQNSYYNTL